MKVYFFGGPVHGRSIEEHSPRRHCFGANNDSVDERGVPRVSRYTLHAYIIRGEEVWLYVDESRDWRRVTREDVEELRNAG